MNKADQAWVRKVQQKAEKALAQKAKSQAKRDEEVKKLRDIVEPDSSTQPINGDDIVKPDIVEPDNPTPPNNGNDNPDKQ